MTKATRRPFWSYPAHLWLVLSIASAMSLTIPLVAFFAGTEPQQVAIRDLSPQESGALASYATGLRAYRQGKYFEAVDAFEQVQPAKSPVLIAAAADAARRTRRLLALPAVARDPVLFFAEQPALQWLWLALGTILAFSFAISWLRRFPLREGCEIGRFLTVLEGGAASEENLRQLLRNGLEHIDFRLRRPGGFGAAIGPALATDALLPAADQASSMSEALAGLGQLFTKGDVGFALGQAGRVMAVLQPRRRYFLSGLIRPGAEKEVQAWAVLTDRRERKELARIVASSAEATFSTSSSATDRARADPAQQAVKVLGFKVWHALSTGARPGMRPNSWMTLAQFVSGLDALAEFATGGMTAAKTEQALLAFDAIVSEIDPGYVPARFFRAFCRLLKGELDACAAQMMIIRDRVIDAAQIFGTAVGSQWVERHTWPKFRLIRSLLRLQARLQKSGTPGRAVARRLERYRAANRWWLKILIELHGGHLCQAAATWQDYKENDGWAADRPNIRNAFLQIALGTFDQLPDLRAKFSKVIEAGTAGLQSNDAKILDVIIEPDAINKFDNQMHVIEIGVESVRVRANVAPFMRSIGLESSEIDRQLRDEIHNLKSAMIRLKDDALGVYFESTLQQIEQHIDVDDIAGAGELVRAIRDHTQVARPSGSFLYQRDVPEPTRFVNYLFPLLGKVHSQRQIIVEDRFFLESCYYRLLSLYHSLRLLQLREVADAEHDFILRTYILEAVPAEDSPTYELTALLKCLVATAAARLSLIGDFDFARPDEIRPVILVENDLPGSGSTLDRVREVRNQASSSLRSMIGELIPDLRQWRQNGTGRMKASAASLLAHVSRLRMLEDRQTVAFPEDEADPLQLLEEAVGHEPSVIRYIELAELLVSKGQIDVADRYLSLARRLAPHHPVVVRWLRSGSVAASGRRQRPRPVHG
jgi:hypothetical protein